MSASPTVSRQVEPGNVLHSRVAASLQRQGMMQHLGVQLIEVGPGLCTLTLPYSDKVTQQQGGFHGGAVGALADIAGGYAALTSAPEGMEVTTVEYKINFLAAFKNGTLRATGNVLKAGKRIIITTAQVVHIAPDGTQTDCAVMQQTLVPVLQTY
jgi:uncharacterized protein (TIGR00369 family)